MDKPPPSSPFQPADFAQTHPGLAILRLAALLADGGEADEETLDLMFEQMEVGALDDLTPAVIWAEFSRGLMGARPGAMVKALRECGVLEQLFPEVSSVFGVPQITDSADEIDLGLLLVASLDEAGRRAAPLEVRVALLLVHAGKSDSPREHLPVHYRHIERAIPRIEAACDRYDVPDRSRDLALLALHECERVQRASPVRAGPLAAMLDRTGAFRDPDLFEALMLVATCDYFGHGDRTGETHPKVDLLTAARDACTGLDEDGLDAEGLALARAQAIASAFRSERWAEA